MSVIVTSCVQMFDSLRGFSEKLRQYSSGGNSLSSSTIPGTRGAARFSILFT